MIILDPGKRARAVCEILKADGINATPLPQRTLSGEWWHVEIAAGKLSAAYSIYDPDAEACARQIKHEWLSKVAKTKKEMT